MAKFRELIGATLALAMSLSAFPAQAQLLGGGSLGGMLDGAGGIGIGGINGGISGTVDTTTRTTIRAPRVRSVPSDTIVAAQVTNVVPHGAAAVSIPAVADVAVRRTAIVEAGIVPVPVIAVPAYVDQQYVVFEDELRGSGVDVVKRGQQIVLEMPSDVTFAFDRYNIQPRFYRVLDAVARTLNHYPAMYIDVYGHTDAIGSYAYNQVLSEKRADTVADYLADRSVTRGRLHVEGFGKTQPIASNATIAGRAANRRVEVVLTPYTS